MKDFAISGINNAFGGIVLAAKTFNPSIFTESWLVQNHVIASEDFTGPRFFSAEVSQFQTSLLQVVVLPPRMQITFNICDPNTDSNIPNQFTRKIVELLPHTPYQSLGLNFDYFLQSPVDIIFHDYCRSLLGDGSYKLLQEFSSTDAKFGRYFSKDQFGARLKLDIKPVHAGPDNKDMLQFSFNYHFDVTSADQGKRSAELIQYIENWPLCHDYAKQLVAIGSL